MNITRFICHIRFLILILLSFQFYYSQGQQQTIDSLQNLISSQSNTIQKVRFLNELALQAQAIDINQSNEKAEEALSLASQLGDEHGIAIAHIRLGRVFDLKSEYDSAFIWYSKGLKIGNNVNDLLVQAQALVYMGATHRNQGNYEQALENLQASLLISQQLQNPYWEAFALNIIGLVYLQQSKYKVALEASLRALKIRQGLGLNLDIASSLNNVGLNFDYMGDFPKALKYYFKARDLQEEIGNINGLAQTWNNIGIVYSFQGERELSLEAFQKALVLHTQMGNKLNMAGTMDNIGINFYDRGMYVKALDHYYRALTIREDIGDKNGMATSYANIAHILSIQNKSQLALKNYEKGLSILVEIGDQNGIAHAQYSLGSEYYDLNDFEKSLEHHNSALKIREEIGYANGISESLVSIGGVYLKMKEYDKAKEEYKKSLKIAEDIGHSKHQINGLKGLAYTYYYLKNHKLALNFAKQAMSLADSSQAIKSKSKIHGLLADIYSELRQFEEAYENQFIYTSLEDSILNIETSKQLTQMQVKFDTEKKERLIADQEHKLKLLAASNSYQTRLTWIGSLVVLLLFGLIVLYRSKWYALKAKNMHRHYSRLLLRSQEDERKRISRDLHDSIGQSLVLIKNHLFLSQQNNNDTISMVSNVLEEVGSLSKGLHPEMLESFGLTASIENLVISADESTDMIFTQEIENIDGVFSKEQEVHIYRIIQEAIQNMIKYSRSVSAQIKVGVDEKNINIKVKDHGIGFDVRRSNTTSHSLGMKTMKERAQILGGKIIVKSAKNKGTSIMLILNNKRSLEDASQTEFMAMTS